jgi:hypothetical protein
LLTITPNAGGSYNYDNLAPSVTFGGTATLQDIELFAGNVEDQNIDFDNTVGFIVPPLVKSKWKTIPAAVNFPEYLWMGKQGKNVVGLGAYNGYTNKTARRGYSWPSSVREMV